MLRRSSLMLLGIDVPAVVSAADPGPMHRIQLHGNPTITSAVFSPGSDTLYVLVPDQAINAWALLAHYWPAVGGAIAGVMVLAFLLVLRRVLRTPRLTGEPYCRRCNYCLKGAVSERCPECFTPTDRHIVGRSTRQRLKSIALITGAIVVGYAAPCIASLGWLASGQGPIEWWSYRLESVAKIFGVQLGAWNQPVDRIYEIDVLAGRVRRTLITKPMQSAFFYRIDVTPDGRGLLIAGQGDQLALVSTESGEILKTLPGPSTTPPLPGTSNWQQVAGFDDVGQNAYVVYFDETPGRIKLMQWNLTTGESSVLLDCAGHACANMVVPFRMYRIPGQPLRFLEVPEFLAASMSSYQLPMKVHGWKSDGVVRTEFELPVYTPAFVGLSSDGSRLYNPVATGLEPIELKPDQPPPQTTLVQPYIPALAEGTTLHVGRMVQTHFGLDAGTDLGNLTKDFTIFDLDAPKQLATFRLHVAHLAGKAFMARDGRFFAAAASMRGPTGPHQELLIYDLRDLSSEAD